jgi:hypothetical protein
MIYLRVFALTAFKQRYLPMTSFCFFGFRNARDFGTELRATCGNIVRMLIE